MCLSKGRRRRRLPPHALQQRRVVRPQVAALHELADETVALGHILDAPEQFEVLQPVGDILLCSAGAGVVSPHHPASTTAVRFGDKTASNGGALGL